MSFTLQRAEKHQPPPSQLDECIHWLTLATHPMDLGTFSTMMASIDELCHAQLTAWKASFTSTFLASLKQSLQPHRACSEPKWVLVAGVSSFAAFASVYDGFWKEILGNRPTEAETVFLTAFFEFCSGYRYVLSDDAAAVDRELWAAKRTKWAAAESELCRVVRELTCAGAKLPDLLVSKMMMGGL